MTQNIFSSLLRDKQSLEVNVSKAFQICFSQSASFRSKVIRLLASVCGVSSSMLASCDWDCGTEIVRKHGRLDIVLSPDGGGRRIILESKVAAPLTKRQMLNYRRGEARDFVIALTKRHPEPGRKWLEDHDCLAVRWQEIHRALRDGSNGRGVDAFLCRSFQEYLEEIDMAYKGEVTLTDLRRITRLLAVARSANQMSEIRARPAFGAALDVLSLLDEVIAQATDLLPILGDWGRWGPSYFKWREADTDYHHFAFRLKKNNWRAYSGAGFVLPNEPNGRILWATHVSIKGSKDADEKTYYSREWCSRKGDVVPSALARLFVKDVKKSWLV